MTFLITFALLQIAAVAGWLQKGYPWVRFAAAQFFQLEAAIVGVVLLITFCLAQSWETSPAPSIKDGTRVIDRWKWRWIGYAFDNPEDGVSGQQALIWVNGELKPYMPDAWPPWRAYCWSAWRNSADALKYRFAWDAGPLKQWTLFGRQQHAGWKGENGSRVPVISL